MHGLKGQVRVLVVDDSSFFRKRIREQLEGTGEIQIVGEASNGQEAVECAARLRPDLITMDVAMPGMDGIAAVREIMRTSPTHIIMFSALTRDGARATLEALEAGAVEYLPKLPRSTGGTGGNLGDCVLEIARSRPARPMVPPLPDGVAPPPRPAKTTRRSAREQRLPQVVLIGASTGGPVAIQRVLRRLPDDFPCPLVVAVHMPAEFTSTFAERLDRTCRLQVGLAADGDVLRPGRALIAPGGQQTLLERRDGRIRTRIVAGGDQIYRPSVDILFGSAARSLGRDCLAIVLTGMGADGTDGARLLKDRGSGVWTQDQATSVVYGMPQSVAKARLTDRMLPLDQIGEALSGLA